MLILKALGLLLSGLQHCIREQAQFEGSAMGLKSKWHPISLVVHFQREPPTQYVPVYMCILAN